MSQAFGQLNVLDNSRAKYSVNNEAEEMKAWEIHSQR